MIAYKSWISAKNYNRIVIRYEDLENNKLETLKNLIIFVNKISGIKEIDEKKFSNAIQSTNFKNLRIKEKLEGFPEPFNLNNQKRLKFFNLGFENKWQKILPEKVKMRLNVEIER